jgi:hypothetical protein
MISPAQAAGISRILSNAGLKKAIEIHKGAELEGYAAAPMSDHVRVEYVPNVFTDIDDVEAINAGLDQCEHVLREHGGYELIRCIQPVACPGEWRDLPVLEVRKR